LRPVGRAGSEAEELAKDAKDIQDHHNPFLQLPNELLLMVANSLDRQFQVLSRLIAMRQNCEAAILAMP
jgi:hypothetical protein